MLFKKSTSFLVLILIRYHIVWLLVVILSRRTTREAMQDFPSDKKRRKEWEDTCGPIHLPKDMLIFLSTLALIRGVRYDDF